MDSNMWHDYLSVMFKIILFIMFTDLSSKRIVSSLCILIKQNLKTHKKLLGLETDDGIESSILKNFKLVIFDIVNFLKKLWGCFKNYLKCYVRAGVQTEK